jgi:hypothetical protein
MTWITLTKTQIEEARPIFKDIFKDINDIDTMTLERGPRGYILFASTMDGGVINQKTISVREACAVLTP